MKVSLHILPHMVLIHYLIHELMVNLIVQFCCVNYLHSVWLKTFRKIFCTLNTCSLHHEYMRYRYSLEIINFLFLICANLSSWIFFLFLGQTMGWPGIRLRVFHELIYAARQLGNNFIVIRYRHILRYQCCLHSICFCWHNTFKLSIYIKG